MTTHLSRRDLLRVGTLGPLGLGLSSLLNPSTASASPMPSRKPTAKSVILLYMWGGPSHIDTWDPKPNAPVEVRGEFQSIPTAVPGVRISEHFPRLARLADRYCIVRSMSHTDPAHLSPTHHLMTGRRAAKLNSDADGPSRSDAPCMGAVVSKYAPCRGPIPSAITLPWNVSHPAAPGGTAPGQNGGWLGSGFDPFLVTGNPADPAFRVAGLGGSADVPGDRLHDRAELLHRLDHGGIGGGFDGLQTQALDLLSSAKVAEAFDLSRESQKTRDHYGRHQHGQCCLLARRLVEAGSRLVTVNWPDDAQGFWDTHGNNFPSLKTRLMPHADLGFSALLDDLSARGMLDETLVVWVGEFGRTPKVENAGRQHWPGCYSAVLAGGGVRGGTVYGSSDRIGARPTDLPTSPADLTATIYRALGIDPSMPVLDRLGRELTLTEGTAIGGIF